MTIYRHWLALAGAICALFGLTLTPTPASATILLVSSNIAPISDAAAPFPATLVLTRTFTTTVPNQLIRVVYNAECSIGGATTNWLDDNITIDGVVAPPSNSDNALCSGNGTASQNDGWVSAVTQVYLRVPNAGAHVINVIVQPMPGAGAPWRIDDQSLVIDTQ
jgi:hypothetical protein